jgi:hypothetical protein
MPLRSMDEWELCVVQSIPYIMVPAILKYGMRMVRSEHIMSRNIGLHHRPCELIELDKCWALTIVVILCDPAARYWAVNQWQYKKPTFDLCDAAVRSSIEL